MQGIRCVRFTNLHLNDFSDRVIAAMAETPEVCEHVGRPMQSGCSRDLKRMLPRHAREGFMDCVSRLRGVVDSLSLTTDIIVGFPVERGLRGPSPPYARSALTTPSPSSSPNASAPRPPRLHRAGGPLRRRLGTPHRRCPRVAGPTLLPPPEILMKEPAEAAGRISPPLPERGGRLLDGPHAPRW
jgi:hypothetical protein